MARPLRIEFSNAWYYVINHGRGEEYIFLDQQDYQFFADLLRGVSEMFRVRIAAFCLMPHAYHLAVQTPEANLTLAMRHVGGMYARYFNKRYGYDGKLCRGRYKAVLFETGFLPRIIHYLHSLPVRAGLVEMLAGYPWSSHRAYLSRHDACEWLHTEALLSAFSDVPEIVRNRYLQLMARQADVSLERSLAGQKVHSILGNQTFKKQIRQRFRLGQGRPQKARVKNLSAISIRHIKSAVCHAYNAHQEKLYASSRGVINEPRNVAIYLARILRGETLFALGREFRMDNPSTVGSAIHRVRLQLAEDPLFAARVDMVRQQLSALQVQSKIR